MEGNGSPELPHEANVVPSLRTKLDPEVQIPWLRTFELGQGFDAVTGQSKVSSPFRDTRSLKVFPDSDPPTLDVNLGIVHGQHEISNKRRFRGQGTINFHSPLTLEASFSSERSSSDSKTSFMIEQYASGEYHFETLNVDQLQLTDKAQSLLQRSHREFRDLYGDYFIVGYQRRFTFSVLIECNTLNEQSTKQTEHDAKVALQNALSAGVDYTKYMKTSKFEINSAARVSQSGCDFQIRSISSPGDSVAIKDVIKMLRIMKKAQPKGRKEIALLRHYSQLCDSLPDSAPVAPAMFDEIRELNSLAWELESSQFHPACDWITKRMIMMALNTFTEGRSSFIGDGASLKKSQNALSEVNRLLDDRLRGYDFVMKVIDASRCSPPVGLMVEASSPNQKWTYGFVAVTSRQKAPEPWKMYTSVMLDNVISAYEVVLETAPRLTSQNLFFHSSISPGTRPDREASSSTEVTVSGMEGYIVGWTLSCRTPTQVKKMFTVRNGGLTCNHMEICVEPTYRFREHIWRCRIYFVNERMYNFASR